MEGKIGTCNQDVRGLKIAMFTHFSERSNSLTLLKKLYALIFRMLNVIYGPETSSLVLIFESSISFTGWKVMGSYFLDARSMSLWPSKFPKTECLLDFGDMSP